VQDKLKGAILWQQKEDQEHQRKNGSGKGTRANAGRGGHKPLKTGKGKK